MKIVEYRGQPLHLLEDASDATNEILKRAEDIWEGWFADEPHIEWDAFWDRLASYGEIATPKWDIEDLDTPFTRAVQKHIRQIARENKI